MDGSATVDAVEINEARLRAACGAVLRQWPEVKAAVLFGSRARGTHRPDSDWDVALILDGDKPERARPALGPRFPRAAPLARIGRVDAWALTERYLRRRSVDLGSLPYAVCRDGRVLAGRLALPRLETMQSEIAMNPEDWKSRMRKVLSRLDAAVTQIERIATAATWDDCAAHCGDLLRDSANAAELLVKAAMERRGVAVDRVHDIDRLARAFAKERPHESELSKHLAALNGGSRSDHLAIYDDAPPSAAEVRRALRRTHGVLALWADEATASLDDEMTAAAPVLAAAARRYALRWQLYVESALVPKTAGDSDSREAAEAALDECPELLLNLKAFRNRLAELERLGSDDDGSPSPF